MAITTDIKASTLEIKGKGKKRKGKRRPLPKAYAAPPGSARERTMRRAAKLYKTGKKAAAFKMREKQEAQERRKRRGKK